MSDRAMFDSPVMGRREFEAVMVERLWAAWSAAVTTYALIPRGDGTYRERLEAYGNKLSAFEALAALVGAYLGTTAATVAQACERCPHSGALVAALEQARREGDGS